MKLEILAFADFPSPYRVEVFKGLSAFYDLTVFFDKMSDQNRNAKWFCKDTGLHSYSLLTQEGKIAFATALKRISEYDLVLAYDYHIKNAIKLQARCMTKHVPYIMNLDGAFIRKNIFKNLVKRWLVSGATAYFVSGKMAAEYFVHFGANPAKIYYHPFTSLHKDEILKSPISEQQRMADRDFLGLPQRKTIISIGQFIHRKGFDILLESWRDLDNKYQLIIVGGGEEKSTYKQIIHDKGYKNVQLMEFMEKEQLFQYYYAADAFVLPTREDIWGLVVNEAMACGLPVITTDMCLASDELLKDTNSGYIVPVENAEALHNAMEKLLESDKSQEMGKNGLVKIREYTYENVVKAHVEAITKLMGRD